VATLATRLKAFDDRAKAREKWLGLMNETEGKSDQHVWYLLAAQEAAVLSPVKPVDAVGERIKLINAYLEETRKKGGEAPTADVPKVRFRDCRNRYRDVIELYGDESDDKIRDAVASAKAALEKLAQAGKD